MGDVMIIMLEDERGEVLDGAVLWVDCSMEQLKSIRIVDVSRNFDGEAVLKLQMMDD